MKSTQLGRVCIINKFLHRSTCPVQSSCIETNNRLFVYNTSTIMCSTSCVNIGSVDLLSHFTKVKCDSWTWFFCMVLVTQGIPATGVKRALATSTAQKT